MKKLLGIVFLGLLWCNVGFTENLDISGTTWKFKESDGDVKLFKFHSNGKCSYVNIKSYSGNEGQIISEDESNCYWNQNGVLMTLQLNDYYMVRTAIIDGTTMKGNFASNYDGGIQGTFIGKLNSYK